MGGVKVSLSRQPVDSPRLSRRSSTVAGLLFLTLLAGGCQQALTAETQLTGTTGVPTQSPMATDEVFVLPDTDGSPEIAGEIDSLDAQARAIIESWTLRELVSSLFLVHVPGSDYTVHEQFLAEHPVAGFLILGDNLPSSVSGPVLADVRRLATPDLLVAVDQEGGAVQRLRPDALPSASDLGEGDPEFSAEAAVSRSQMVFDAGANLNLGLVADVSPGAEAYIHSRSFGTDTELVTEHVAAAAAATVSGVGMVVKHFPGHGLTEEDTHRTLGVSSLSREEWESIHAPPFLAAIERAVPALMTGHLVVEDVDSLPASLSPEWSFIIRNEWGFRGVIVTDDLSMLEDSGDERFESLQENAVLAVQAGADLLIDSGGLTATEQSERISGAVERIVSAIESGELSLAAVESSAERVLVWRLSLGAVPRPLEDSESGELSSQTGAVGG